MDRNKFPSKSSILQDVTVSLQFLIPFIGLSTLRDYEFLSLFGCHKSNVPLIPDWGSSRFAQFPLFPYREMCQNIEYVDNLLNDIQTSLKQTIIWAACFVLISSIHSYVNKICKIGKPVNLVDVWLKTSTTAFCLQMLYYRYSFNSLSKFVNLCFTSLVMFAKLTKYFIYIQLNEINVFLPCNVSQWIAAYTIAITMGIVLILKTIRKKRRDYLWKMAIRDKKNKLEMMEISLFDISRASFECEMLVLKNQKLIGKQRIDVKRQPKILFNIFPTAFMDFMYRQVMLLCRKVARKHDLNDSESMLLQWTCFTMTDTLFEEKGNICRPNHKMETLLKLGSMLNWNSQAFTSLRLIENSKNLANTRDQDVFFNIFFEQNDIILRSKILNIPSLSSDNQLKLCNSRNFPLPPRLHKRMVEYKVLSFYGSAQRINGALKDFESQTVQYLRDHFMMKEGVPNNLPRVTWITTSKWNSEVTLDSSLEWQHGDIQENFLRTINNKQIFNSIPSIIANRYETESRIQSNEVGTKETPNFKEFIGRTKIDSIRNK